MKLDWIYEPAQTAKTTDGKDVQMPESWYLIDKEKTEKSPDGKGSTFRPIGVMHRVENDNWLLWDLRAKEKPFSLPQRNDKTLVECKNKLIELIEKRK